MGGGTGLDGVQGLTGAPLLSPGTPGKLAPPEVPQTYQDTALVLWKPGHHLLLFPLPQVRAEWEVEGAEGWS